MNSKMVSEMKRLWGAEEQEDGSLRISTLGVNCQVQELDGHPHIVYNHMTDLTRLLSYDVFQAAMENSGQEVSFEISKLGNDIYEGELDYAKCVIREFCLSEYESEPDFDDLKEVSIFYTELGEDNQFPVQVVLDLEDFKVSYWMTEDEPTLIKEDSYADMKALISNELMYLNFDAFVSEFRKPVEQAEAKETSQRESSKRETLER